MRQSKENNIDEGESLREFCCFGELDKIESLLQRSSVDINSQNKGRFSLIIAILSYRLKVESKNAEIIFICPQMKFEAIKLNVRSKLATPSFTKKKFNCRCNITSCTQILESIFTLLIPLASGLAYLSNSDNTFQ